MIVKYESNKYIFLSEDIVIFITTENSDFEK